MTSSSSQLTCHRAKRTDEGHAAPLCPPLAPAQEGCSGKCTRAYLFLWHPSFGLTCLVGGHGAMLSVWFKSFESLLFPCLFSQGTVVGRVPKLNLSPLRRTGFPWDRLTLSQPRLLPPCLVETAFVQYLRIRRFHAIHRFPVAPLTG